MQGKLRVLFFSLFVSAIQQACDGDEVLPQNGRITLLVTDAPVDEAEVVVIEFSSVTLIRNNGHELRFSFDNPKSLNLLALQNGISQPLLENVEIPAGKYAQIRLGVNAEFDNRLDSYITINGASYELRIPSGSQSGLKLNTPFTVAAGTLGISVADADAVYTIDFDLRKSVVKPVGQPGYFLKPVLRLVQNQYSGHVTGLINPGLLTGTSCSDQDPLSGNAVYVYSGLNVVPDDIDAIAPEPIASTLVNYNVTSGLYSYQLSYLPEGSYTLAFTCAADLDTDHDEPGIVFAPVINVDVNAGQTTNQAIN